MNTENRRNNKQNLNTRKTALINKYFTERLGKYINEK